MRVRLLGLPWLVAGALAAQVPPVADPGTTARGGVVYESYSLGSGLAFDRISVLTVPVALAQRVGSRLTLDIGTAYARASVRTVGGTLEHSGAVDTDIRAALAVVPGRLILTLVGTLPTGAATVPDTTLPLFGATATDLFGFSTQSFGGGGGLVAGFATAARVGRTWALGAGASYRHAASYVPVAAGGELSPGAEGRFRFGLEGPVGRGGYVRGALVYTLSGRDELAGGGTSIIGDRVLGYAALSLPLGRGALSLYGWDMRRRRPRQLDTEAIQVPRGNVLAIGARLDRPLSSVVTLSPSLEFRHELSGTATLELLGYVVRPGTDLRYRVRDRATVVAQAQLALGRLYDEGIGVSVVGPRLGLLLEWAP